MAQDKKDRKRRREAAMVDEGWVDIAPEDMQAAADLLAQELRDVKGALNVQVNLPDRCGL